MSLVKEITIKIKGASPMDLRRTVQVFENFSKQDAETQGKVLELLSDQKALKKFTENFDTLKQFL